MKALDVYKPPFRHDGVFIWSENDVMALMIEDEFIDDYPLLDRTCDILNGKCKPKGDAEIVHANGEIFCNRKHMFTVRGYGHLTSSGGFNLPMEEAIRLQDEFACWVCTTLTNQDNG